jgi:hypothetical protein
VGRYESGHVDDLVGGGDDASRYRIVKRRGDEIADGAIKPIDFRVDRVRAIVPIASGAARSCATIG